MADRIKMARLVRREEEDREFDLDFWQSLGDAKLFAAAWDLVVTAATARGADEDQLRLQRSVATVRRRRYQIPGGRRVRRH